MESPAKRRKKNDSKPTPIPSRTLDSFFGKNNTKPASHGSVNGATAESKKVPSGNESTEKEQSLTDEELARKLQAEWHEQDRDAQSRSEEPAAVRAETDNPEDAHDTTNDAAAFAAAAPTPQTAQEKPDAGERRMC